MLPITAAAAHCHGDSQRHPEAQHPRHGPEKWCLCRCDQRLPLLSEEEVSPKPRRQDSGNSLRRCCVDHGLSIRMLAAAGYPRSSPETAAVLSNILTRHNRRASSSQAALGVHAVADHHRCAVMPQISAVPVVTLVSSICIDAGITGSLVRRRRHAGDTEDSRMARSAETVHFPVPNSKARSRPNWRESLKPPSEIPNSAQNRLQNHHYGGSCSSPAFRPRSYMCHSG